MNITKINYKCFVKKGFTLAEALIALVIISVVAALALPLVNKFKPDVNKILFLKTYDALVESVNYLSGNEKLYPILDEKTGLSYLKAPFGNTVEVSYNGNNYGGDSAKICELLSLMLKGENTSCDASYKEYSDESFSPSFTTPTNASFL